MFAAWSFQSGSESLYEESFDITPGKLLWEWEGKDLGDFQLWLRVSFNNHRSLYYIADGSVIGEYKVHLLS